MRLTTPFLAAAAAVALAAPLAASAEPYFDHGGYADDGGRFHRDGEGSYDYRNYGYHSNDYRNGDYRDYGYYDGWRRHERENRWAWMRRWEWGHHRDWR